MSDPSLDTFHAEPTRSEPDDRLDSWKEIAAHLNRDVRTVRRWEKAQGLPVHRHQHGKGASVYAFRSELDAWWRGAADNHASRETVAAAEPAKPPSAIETPRPASLARRWIAAVAVLILLAAPIAWWLRPRTSEAAHRPGKITIAVLPFQNMTGQPAQDYISDGLTEEMITALALLRHDRLAVIARTSAMAYKGTSKPVSQIGRELSADYVLEGSVRRWGDRVRITAQLIETRNQTHVWAGNYDSERRDTLRVQDEIAQTIAGQISLALSPEQRSRITAARAVDPQVHELCLLARYQWNKRTEATVQRARDYFQQAIDRDPNYAPAWAGLAQAYVILAYYQRGAAREAFAKAQHAAERALELDDSSFEAHAALAIVLGSRAPLDAEREFRRALELNPGYATAHQWFAFHLWHNNRREEALAEMERARALDPLALIVYSDEAALLLSARDTDRAVRLIAKGMEIDPNFPELHRAMALAQMQRQRMPEAIAEARRAVELDPNDGERATLGFIYGMSGQRTAAEQILRQLRTAASPGTSPYYLAFVYTGLGRFDEAVACLEKEYARDSPLVPASSDPILLTLGDYPGYQKLLRRIDADHARGL